LRNTIGDFKPQEAETMLKNFLIDEDGQTLVEYGLLISLIALVVIAVLTVMGRRISNTFNSAAGQMNDAG
jgi:pilus assembly protein Flp/PilA